MLKVASFCSDSTGVAYYRMRSPLEEAQKQGLLECKPGDMKVWPVYGKDSVDQEAFARYEKIADWADILVTQRHTTFEGAAIFRGMSIIQGGIPWVLEIDDNIIELDSVNPAHELYHKRTYDECYGQRVIESVEECEFGEAVFKNEETGQLVAVKTKQADHLRMNVAQIQDADAMIVSTQTLKLRYSNMRREHHPRDIVHVCPNSLNVEKWDTATPAPDHGDEIWVGWAGGAAHIADVELIAPVVHQMLMRYPKVRFFWTRVPNPSLMRLAQTWRERCVCVDGWSSIEDWVDYYKVLNFDIALAPLIDTPFNRAKSNLKWLEAGVMRQPMVCSRVDPYVDSVHNRRDGFLASRTSQFVRHVNALIESKTLREQIGGAARERVEQEFSLAKNAHRWVDAYTDIVEKLGDQCRKRQKEVRYADDAKACA